VWRILSGLWPWEWRGIAAVHRLLGDASGKCADSLLGLVTADHLKKSEKLRRFLVTMAERGEDQFVCCLLMADASLCGQLALLPAAAQKGRVDTVLMLLRIGAYPDDWGAGRETALHMMARQNQAPVLRALADARADPEAESAAGLTALHAAAAADAALAVRELVAQRAEVEAETSKGHGPLCVAAIKGAGAAAAALIQLKACVTRVHDLPQTTALNEAARHGHLGIMKLLLAAGTPAHLLRGARDAPLHAACRGLHLDCIAELLALVDPNELNREGQTAQGLAFVACRKNTGGGRAAYKQVEQLLRAAGAVMGQFDPTLYG